MPRGGRGDGGMMSADRSRGTRARGANRRGGDEDARVAASKSGNSFVDQFDARAARERDARRRGTHRADRIPLVELALPHARREGLFFAFFGHVRRLTRTWGERARARSSAEDAPVSRARLRFVVRLLKVPDEPPTTSARQPAQPASRSTMIFTHGPMRRLLSVVSRTPIKPVKTPPKPAPSLRFLSRLFSPS